MKKIKVDKVILYYMDRVDPDGNLYRFYVYKGMASEIEYFCTEKAGNMTIPIGEGVDVDLETQGFYRCNDAGTLPGECADFIFHKCND